MYFMITPVTILFGIIVFSIPSHIQQLQAVTALVLLDSLIFNRDSSKSRYDDYKSNANNEDLGYMNTAASAPSYSQQLLIQGGVDVNAINFENATNLTNNPNDSVYGQIEASSEYDVNIVWQDSVRSSTGRNYDIFYKRSSDAGISFGKEINLSNNNGFSEHPQLATSGNYVYVVWADNSFSANREILFARSTDGGITFDDPKNLSNDNGDSHNQEIFAIEDNVYVVWLDKEDTNEGENTSGRILLKSSIDGGSSYGQTLDLGGDSNANDSSFPKVTAYNNHVYVIWNVEQATGKSLSEEARDKNNKTNGLYFVKSTDRAVSFGAPDKLTHPDQEFGEAQIAASGQDVYVVWGGSDLNQISDVFFMKSINNGDTFLEPIAITDNNNKSNNFNPSNVEISVDKIGNDNNLYVAWQSIIPSVGQNNKEEILFKMSSDKGNTFGSTLNLSNNQDISECPSLTIYGGKTYVVWEDLSPGNHEILFTKSI
jgi:hypothetical protein